MSLDALTFVVRNQSIFIFFTNPGRGGLLSKTFIAKNLYDFRIHLNLFEISKQVLEQILL